MRTFFIQSSFESENQDEAVDLAQFKQREVILAEQAGNTKIHVSQEHLEWEMWESYEEHRLSAWIVKQPLGNWKESTCSCPSYLKRYKCRHVVGLTIKRKMRSPNPCLSQ